MEKTASEAAVVVTVVTETPCAVWIRLSPDPLASPIYASFKGMPPLLVQVARNEALYSDAVRLVEAAERDGVSAELDSYDDSVHVFPLFDFLPETEDALVRIGRFVDEVSRPA